MKTFLGAAIAILSICLPSISQTPHSRAEIVQHFCRAQEVTSGHEFQRMVSIRQRIAPVLARVPGYDIHLAVVKSEEVNAHTFNLDQHSALICIPTGIVRFMGDAEGEMAFIYAHEVGHALDDACKSGVGRAQIAPPTFSGAIDRLLGGSGRNPIAEQRACESRADEVGFTILIAAGYDPFDAAAGFGRLEMLLGDSSTGILGRLNEIASDHPMTPDRIRHMRALLLQNLQR